MTRTLFAAVLALLAGLVSAQSQELSTATFAGGCFWCVVSDFDHVEGVVETISGSTGGTLDDPTYPQVTAGGTGHDEVGADHLRSRRVTYEELLEAFWHSVDPTDPGGQFCDRGQSYRTVVFVHDEAQRQAADASRSAAERALGTAIVTPIEDASTFYPAEEYHQDYYQKNPLRYRYYRWGCGRDARVEQVWGERAYQGIAGHG